MKPTQYGELIGGTLDDDVAVVARHAVVVVIVAGCLECRNPGRVVNLVDSVSQTTRMEKQCPHLGQRAGRCLSARFVALSVPMRRRPRGTRSP